MRDDFHLIKDELIKSSNGTLSPDTRAPDKRNWYDVRMDRGIDLYRWIWIWSVWRDLWLTGELA